MSEGAGGGVLNHDRPRRLLAWVETALYKAELAAVVERAPVSWLLDQLGLLEDIVGCRACLGLFREV